MDESVQALLRDRKQLFADVTRGIKPARVPTLSNVWSWKVFDAGYNLTQALYDYDKMADAVYQFQRKYNFDANFDIGGRNPVQVLNQFEADMRQTDVALLSYELTSGTVGLSGETATVVLDAQIDAKDGGEAQITRESVLLVRQDDNWCIKRSALESLMVRD